MDGVAHDQRNRQRFAFNVRCQLRSFGGIRRQARTVDISTSGVRVEAMHRLSPGEPVSLDLGEYRNIPARVIWSTPSFTGIQFTTPLHPAIFDELTAGQVTEYAEDPGDLDELARRASLDASRCHEAVSAGHAGTFGADLRRAAMINRVVQRLRAQKGPN